MKAIIFDFNDSFTYNILSELKSFKIHCDVVHISSYLCVSIKDYDFVVLGPGPGLISEYDIYRNYIKELINKSRNGEFNLLGICLGHQLIQSILGREIVQLSLPIHGQSKRISVPNHSVILKELRGTSMEVQFYNSWAIKNEGPIDTFDQDLVDEQGMVLASFSLNITTYQFHPESVGTSCPKSFFSQSLV